MFGWLKNLRIKPVSHDFAATAKPDYREVATTQDGRDITRYWLTDAMQLPPQDPLLQKIGGVRYDIYREVLSDWQVHSVFQQRQLALTACEWTVEPGGTKRADKKAAAWLEETLKHVGWDDATQGMHYGVFYGFAVAEMIYARDGATVAIDAVKVRDRSRFTFLPSGELRLLTHKDRNLGEPLPEHKFWYFATGADHDDEPYGMGLAHWLYWPVQFKRGNIKFWLIAAEKFGSPTAVGWFPPGTSNEDRARLLAALKAIQLDSGVILPDGMRAELLEAKRASGIDYERLCVYLDQAIAKICLGQVMTSEAVGGQYKADVQNQVRQELIKADADLLCESFNKGPVRWLTDWNFPGAAYPRVFRLTEPEEDLSGHADRDRKLFDVGYRPTLAQVIETYGGEWELVQKPMPSESIAPPVQDEEGDEGEEGEDEGDEDGESEDMAPAFADLSLAKPQSKANPMAPLVNRLGVETEPLLQALLAPVRALLADSADLETFQAGLLGIYPDLDAADFAALMEHAVAVADAAGRFDADRPAAPASFASHAAPLSIHPHITVNLAEQAAPNITVNIPENPAPNITVESPNITVESPNITVNVPEQTPPNINIEAPNITVNMPEHIDPQISIDQAETARLERERAAEALAFSREAMDQLRNDDA